MSVTVLDGNAAAVDDTRPQRPKWVSAHETYQWSDDDERHVCCVRVVD
jgi:hypothetical protein